MAVEVVQLDVDQLPNIRITAPGSQIYVGGSAEYEAYQELHPEGQQSAQNATTKARAYRGKQDAAMRKATARDLSDPFPGARWADLGWVRLERRQARVVAATG